MREAKGLQALREQKENRDFAYFNTHGLEILTILNQTVNAQCGKHNRRELQKENLQNVCRTGFQHLYEQFHTFKI